MIPAPWSSVARRSTFRPRKSDQIWIGSERFSARPDRCGFRITQEHRAIRIRLCFGNHRICSSGRLRDGYFRLDLLLGE